MALVSNANLVIGVAGGPTTTLPWCDVSSFRQEPVLSDDGMQAIGLRTTITGSVSFADEAAYAQFRAAVASTRSQSAPLQYTVQMRDPGGSFTTLSTWAQSVPDDLGGPFLDVTEAVEVTGIRYIRCNFTIRTQSARPTVISTGAAGTAVPIVGLSWKQRIVVGPDGRLQRHVDGMVSCAPGLISSGSTTPSPDNTAANWTDRLAYADLFRHACIPLVPGEGWRRTRQEYGYNPQENALAFQFTDEQYRMDIPWPAEVGEFDFEAERTLADAGAARLTGRIALSAGNNVNPRQLIGAAFDLMAARILPGRDLIQRMNVRERNITGQVAIEIEVEAMVYSQNTLDTAALAITAMVGCPFTVKRAAATTDVQRTVNPYGSPSVIHAAGWGSTSNKWYWMQPHWIGAHPTFQTALADAMTLGQATLVEFTDTAGSGIVSVVVANDDTFVSAMNATLDDGPYPGQYPKQADSGGYPTTMLNGFAESRTVLSPGVCRLCTAYNTGADFVFQIEKPVVILTEKATVTRLNQNPAKPMRPSPTGFIVLDEKWNVEAGAGDPQGQRAYKGTFVRTGMAYDGGGTTSGGYSNTTIGSLTLRKWSPPASQVAGALDPTLGPDTQEYAKAAIPDSTYTDTKLVSAITASTVVT